MVGSNHINFDTDLQKKATPGTLFAGEINISLAVTFAIKSQPKGAITLLC
jgi:hypothetical protein